MNKIPKGQLVHYIFITKLTLASLVVGVINQDRGEYLYEEVGRAATNDAKTAVLASSHQTLADELSQHAHIHHFHKL